MSLFRKFLARNLQTNYLFKTVSKRYFSHRLVLGVMCFDQLSQKLQGRMLYESTSQPNDKLGLSES